MDTLMFSLNAIFPIVLLIVLGYILKRRSFLEESWFKKGNKLIFRVCLPCLLFVNVYNIESFSAINWSVVVYTQVAVVILFILGFLLVKFIVPDHRQKGVILQCIFRSNFAIIGLPLAEALGGAEGVGIAAVLSAFCIPTFNILAIVSLTVFLPKEGGKKSNFKDVLTQIVKNPLIFGVACGLMALGIRSALPVFSLKGDLPFLFNAVNNVSKMAGPFSLIILGGLFDFGVIKNMLKPILIGTLARIVVVPVVCLAIAIALKLDTAAFPALLALFGAPVAVSSVPMAQEMDNDGALAGQLVVWTSIFSIFTLFVFILILRTWGLL